MHNNKKIKITKSYVINDHKKGIEYVIELEKAITTFEIERVVNIYLKHK